MSESDLIKYSSDFVIPVKCKWQATKVRKLLGLLYVKPGIRVRREAERITFFTQQEVDLLVLSEKRDHQSAWSM